MGKSANLSYRLVKYIGVDPLSLVNSRAVNGRIPEKVVERVHAKFPVLADAVKKIEETSGLMYPPYYVSPVLILAEGPDGIAILYSQTIPIDDAGRVRIVVEVSAPLLLYGSRATIHAVMAHELLHYVEFVDRFNNVNVTTEGWTGYTFEAPYRDLGMLASPEKIIRDRKLLKLLNLKFRPNLVDHSLDKKVWEKWVNKNLPVRKIRLEENMVRLSMASILNTKFDENVIQRLKMIVEHNFKRRP